MCTAEWMANSASCEDRSARRLRRRLCLQHPALLRARRRPWALLCRRRTQTTRPLDVATYQPRLLSRLQDSVLLHLQICGTTGRPHRAQLETGCWAAQCWPTSNGAARPVLGHHGQDVEDWWRWETAWEPDGDVGRSRDGLYHLSAPGSRYPRRLHRVRVRQRVVECDPAGYDVTWLHCDMTWRDIRPRDVSWRGRVWSSWTWLHYATPTSPATRCWSSTRPSTLSSTVLSASALDASSSTRCSAAATAAVAQHRPHHRE